MRTKQAVTEYEREKFRRSIHPLLLRIFDNYVGYKDELKCIVCDKIIDREDAVNHSRDSDHKKKKRKGKKKV